MSDSPDWKATTGAIAAVLAGIGGILKFRRARAVSDTEERHRIAREVRMLAARLDKLDERVGNTEMDLDDARREAQRSRLEIRDSLRSMASEMKRLAERIDVQEEGA